MPSLCCHIAQCNWTVWEQNQGAAQEPPQSSARTPKSCTVPSKLQQHNPAAPARLCPGWEWFPVSWHEADPAEGSGPQLHSALNTFPRELLPSHLGSPPEQSTPATPQANAQTCTRLLPAFFCLGFLFACFWFLFSTEKGFQALLSFRDEKQPVVAPYSKLHLWKEITKQCISCAFLSVSEFNRKMARS